MSEALVENASPQKSTFDNPPTPPSSTPSPTGFDTAESKISRKREREVSLEPATPTANDPDPFIRERKYPGLPLKKNRRVGALDPTEEEDDNGSGSRSVSGSPPETREGVLTSPRREMKRRVRQIKQGVEDISWSGPTESMVSEKDVEIVEEVVTAADADTPTTSQVVSNGKTKPEVFIDKLGGEETPPNTQEESPLSRSVPDLKTDTDRVLLPPMRTKSGGDVAGLVPESNEKGLKRKFLERDASQGPGEENGSTAKPAGEPLKRPRDDADKDDNPREAKRPSPPPSPSKSPTVKSFKASGFMAYASTTSPFASIKGQNVFSSKPSGSIFAADQATSQPTPTPTPKPAKRSGFEAFASSSSPFASFARSKSPFQGTPTSKLGRAKSPPRSITLASPFGSYAGSNQVFGLPAQKRQRGKSPNGDRSHSPERVATPTTATLGEAEHESGDEAEEEEEQGQTFGEKLRAARDDEDENKDDDDKPRLTEQDVTTGEEDEYTMHQVRGKLFSLQGNSWKERGMGVLKLNVKQEDGTGARLVMRKDAVYTLLLNVTLFPGMRCTLAQDPRYIRFTAIENGVVTTYNLKMADARVAQDLLEEIHANIPASL